MDTKDTNIEAFFALLRAGIWENVMVLGRAKRQSRVNGEGVMVNGSPLTISDGVDWNKVLDLAEEQSVVGLLAAGIETVQGSSQSEAAKSSAGLKVHGSPLVPKPIALQFVGRTVQLEQCNQAMNQFIAELVEKMREAGIYTLLVKGQGVARCYERPLWRSCGDVDFFMSTANYMRAKEFLIPLASSVEKEYVRERHLEMTIDGWVVELHGSLYSGLSKKIEKELDDVSVDTFHKGSVRAWMDDKVQVFQLSVENEVFYVFTHILQHFYKGGIGLRQICDWCRLLWTYRSELDVAKLEGRLRRAGLMTSWKAFAAFAVDFLGMPIESMPFYADGDKWKRKATRIKDFVLMSGNFGHNRDHSYYEKYPYLVRKCVSCGRRMGDLAHHARIFPIDSLRFFPAMLVNGVRSAMNGEG